MSIEKNPKKDSQSSSLKLLLLLVAVAALWFDERNHQKFGKFTSDGICIGAGILLALVIRMDARNGFAQFTFMEYKKSEEPTAFWVVFVANVCFCCLLIFGPLGNLLGLWDF